MAKKSKSVLGTLPAARAMEGLRTKVDGPDAVPFSPAVGGTISGRDNLERANFRTADLAGRDFAGVNAGESDFTGALLEDASLEAGNFRYAKFSGATLDGARCARADFWGATFAKVEASDADFQGACLRDVDMTGANLRNAVLKHADLHNTDLSHANLQGADLTDSVLKGTNFSCADLRGASLAGLQLGACRLDGVLLGRAWLERSRMTRSQLGGSVGEERLGDFEGALEAYLALELNFRGLGDGDAARWAYCKRRRMGKNCQRQNAIEAFNRGNFVECLCLSFSYCGSATVEFLCDYGESVGRILRAIFLIYALTVITLIGSGTLLKTAPGAMTGYSPTRDFLDVATYTLMTTITASPPAELKLSGQFANLAIGVETAIMIVLLGLLGFVLGNRIRS